MSNTGDDPPPPPGGRGSAKGEHGSNGYQQPLQMATVPES